MIQTQQAPGPLPFLFALGLSGLSLATYFIGALLSRFVFAPAKRTSRSFNLDIPTTGDSETLFAVSLAAAQTTLSTVFIAFLTDAGYFGFHLLYCPVAFAAGNWLMLKVYQRAEKAGYVNESTASGVIPCLMYEVSRSKVIGTAFVLVCFLPPLAILALELHYGLRLLDYVGHHAFPWTSLQGNPLNWTSVILFTVAMGMLLSYVFIGGFRAVVASDVWQYRIMIFSFVTALLCVVFVAFHRGWHLHYDRLTHHDHDLRSFYLGITLINLFEPMSFATTWQRFRAFREKELNFTRATTRAITKVSVMWCCLILIGIGVQLLSEQPITSGDLGAFLDQVVNMNIWFQLFVFPFLIMAGFSGMYSSSDTCISALFYLTEAPSYWRSGDVHADRPIRAHYYWMMLSLYVVGFGMFVFIKRTDQNPVNLAMSLFGATIVLAPSVVLVCFLNKTVLASTLKRRARMIALSISSGFTVYWTAHFLFGVTFLGWSIAAGLLAASIPAGWLVRLEARRALLGHATEAVHE